MTDRPATAARAALAMHAATRGLADATLEPVRGGLSNHAWKATLDGRSFFVRLGGPESATLGVDRESERALLASVATAGLAPRLVICDPSNGLLVTDFIGGGPWRREDARAAPNITRVAERMRLLHRLGPPAGVRAVDFASQARSLEAQLGALGDGQAQGRSASDDAGHAKVTGVVPVAPVAEIRRLADSAFGLLAACRPRLVPCHNDLHHLNLVDDGSRLWIVDWEYGGIGDPLYDLASYACQHELGEDERRALLDAYGARGPFEIRALAAACTAFDYVQWLWYSLWAARHPESGREYASRGATLQARLAAGL